MHLSIFIMSFNVLALLIFMFDHTNKKTDEQVRLRKSTLLHQNKIENKEINVILLVTEWHVLR